VRSAGVIVPDSNGLPTGYIEGPPGPPGSTGPPGLKVGSIRMQFNDFKPLIYHSNKAVWQKHDGTDVCEMRC